MLMLSVVSFLILHLTLVPPKSICLNLLEAEKMSSFLLKDSTTIS